MGEVSRGARWAAAVLVRHRWWILCGCVSLVVTSVIILTQVSMFLDTGIDGMYARQTKVSNRQNLFILMDGTKLLPNEAALVPEDESREFAANYSRATDIISAGQTTSRRVGITADNNGHEEIHVLLRAKSRRSQGADVLAREPMLAACDIQRRTFSAMKDTGVCLRLDNSTDCFPPFSISSVGPALRVHKSFGGTFQAFQKMAMGNLEAMLLLATHVCADSPPAVHGQLLCQHFPDHCDAAGCASSPPSCLVGGLEPCAIFLAARPSAAEIRAVAALPAEDLGARGCSEAVYNWAGLNTTIDALLALQRWGNADPALQLLGLPAQALLDMHFGQAGNRGSNVTRIVFGLPAGPHGESDAATAFTFWAAENVFSKSRSRSLEVCWRQWNYFKKYANRAIVRSLFWVLCAIVFLTLYTWPQVGSLVITLVAVGGILSSFPVALVVYRCVLGINWMGVLHFLGIFIILGIGADDVFVVMEHWKHSEVKMLATSSSHHLSDLEHRLAWTLHHSIAAVTATSFTTIAAFASNLISTITPVRLFGIFMMLLSLINYLIVLTLLPALLAIRETPIAMKRGPRSTDEDGEVTGDESAEHVSLTDGSFVHRTVPDDATPRFVRHTLSTIDETAIPAKLAGLPAKQPLPLGDPPDYFCTRLSISEDGACISRPSDGARQPPRVGPQRSVWGGSKGGKMASEDGYGQNDADDPVELRETHRGRMDGGELDSFAGEGELERVVSAGGEWFCGQQLTCSPEMKRAHGRCVAYTCAGSKYGAVHLFFEDTLTDFVDRHRRAICAVSLLLVLLFGGLAYQLQLPRGRPSVWKDSHNMNRYFSVEELFGFGQQFTRVTVRVIWGVTPRDSGSLDTAYERGEVVLDAGFNLSQPESQRWLADLCTLLAARPNVVHGSVICPMAVLQQYVNTVGGGTFPIPSQDMERYVKLYSQLPLELRISNGIKFGSRTLQDDALIYDSHTRTLHPLLDPRTYGEPTYDELNPSVGWTLGSGAGHAFMEPHASFSGNLSLPVVYKVEYTLTQRWSVPYVELRDVWREEEAWINQQLLSAPPALQRGYQTSDAWSVLEMEETMFNSSRQALLLSLLLAFLTLALMTQNVFVASMATIAIGCIVVIFAGSMYLMGWSLGIVECICITVLVGLAVDYIVHVATAYCHAPSTARTRRDRISFSVGTVGLSVVSGAVTTVGAAAFLFPCEMAVFPQFGMFICITLLASLAFALIVFPAMCALAGPQHLEGDLGQLLRGNFAAFFGCEDAAARYVAIDEAAHSPDCYVVEQAVEMQGHRVFTVSSGGSKDSHESNSIPASKDEAPAVN